MAKISTLTDTFPGLSLNTGLWYVEPDAGNGLDSGTVTVSGGTLSLAGGNYSDEGYYCSVNSQDSYDLTASAAFVRVIPGGGGAGDGDSGIAILASNFSDGYNFDITGGNLQVESTLSDVPTTRHSAAYNATNHAWLKVSEAGGTITFSTSPDAVTWSVFYTTTTESIGTWSASTSYVQLFYGSTSGSAKPSGTTGFQNFNFAPATPPPSTTVAAMSTLTDAFPGSTLAAQWTSYGTATVGSSKLALSCTATYSGVWSTVAYNLTSSHALAKVTADTATGTGADGYQTVMQLSPDGTAGLSFGNDASVNLLARWSDSSGTFTTIATATYNATSHAWLQIAESLGTVTFSTSPDGTTWSSFATIATSSLPFSIGALSVQLYTGHWDGGSDGTSDFADFNLPTGGGGGGAGTTGWFIEAIEPGAAAVLDSYSDTLSDIDIGYVSDVYANPGGTVADSATSAGWFTVQNYAADLVSMSQVIAGYAGEFAADRLSRLAAEAGVGFELVGDAADTPQMGPQQDDTFVNVLQSCEDVDRGLLFESFDQFGLAYRTRVSMCGQSPAVVYDWSGGQLASPPPQPVTDDQFTRNDITLSRQNGSSTVARLTTGPMSVNDPPNGAGDYTYSLAAYLYADSQLQNMANWMLAIGTVPDARYPAIAQDLSRSEVAALMSATAGLGHGDWVQVINPAGQLTPGPIDQLVWGWTETLNSRKWTFTFNMVPESPYATGPQVINANPAFDDGATDGWVAFNGTIAASATPPAGCPTPNAALFTPSGSATAGAIEGSRDQAFPVTPGQGYQASAYVFSNAGTSLIEVGIDWVDGSGNYISTSSVTAAPIPGTDSGSGSVPGSGGWMLLRCVGYAPAGAVTGVARSGRTNFPSDLADTDTMYTTNVEVIYPVSTW